MEAERVGGHRARRFPPQSPVPEGSVLTTPQKTHPLPLLAPRGPRNGGGWFRSDAFR